MSSERPRPKITEEAARILKEAARVAEKRIRERFPEKRRVW
jgi:division protein CdvB (Snf7/Vps24/ESCRT-III family)